jgi:hypothetical protein
LLSGVIHIQSIKVLCLSIIVLFSIYLRPQLFMWYFLYFLLYQSSALVQSKNKLFCSRFFIVALAVSFAFLSMTVLSSVDFSGLNYYGSDFASSPYFSWLIGFSPQAYLARVLFLPLYLFAYPLNVFFKSLLGYQYLLSLCLLGQLMFILFLVCRYRPLLRPLLCGLLLISLFVSAYPIPNVRYYAVLIPSVFAISALRTFRPNVLPPLSQAR